MARVACLKNANCLPVKRSKSLRCYFMRANAQPFHEFHVGIAALVGGTRRRKSTQDQRDSNQRASHVNTA
jgi:hypothetical protein